MNSEKDIEISVCVPAYNEERLILRCLKAISSQININISDVLVGINSSTDKTKQIVEEYSLIDKRVKVVDSPKGKVHAWNALNAVAKNNLRIFQDGDCAAPLNAYSLLLEELQDNDIVGASIERDINGKNFIAKILHFPRRYITPYLSLTGPLYLMNYEKVLKCMQRKLGIIQMPSDIINEDQFLQMVCDKINVSTRVYNLFSIAESIEKEIIREKRICYGSILLKRNYPKLFENFENNLAKDRKVLNVFYHQYCLFKLSTVTEKILFPIMIVLKHFLYRYIHSQSKKIVFEESIKWK